MHTCAWPEHSPFLSTAAFNYFLSFLVNKPLPPSQTGIVLVSMMEVHEYWPPASHLKSESSSRNVRRHLVAMVTCFYQLLFVLLWEDELFCVFLCCECLWTGMRESLRVSYSLFCVSFLFECGKRSVCWFTDDLELEKLKGGGGVFNFFLSFYPGDISNSVLPPSGHNVWFYSLLQYTVSILWFECLPVRKKM